MLVEDESKNAKLGGIETIEWIWQQLSAEREKSAVPSFRISNLFFQTLLRASTPRSRRIIVCAPLSFDNLFLDNLQQINTVLTSLSK